MIEKCFISPDCLRDDSCELACKVYDSRFNPNYLVALWRGGSTVGIMVQESLKVMGVPTNHIAVRTSAYKGTEIQHEIRVYGLDYLVNTLNHDDRLLVVDDVFDTGRSINAFLETLQRKLRRNMPAQVKVATVYYKPRNNETDRVPDYFIYQTDKWLVFPHELEDLTLEEIRSSKGERVADLLSARLER